MADGERLYEFPDAVVATYLQRSIALAAERQRVDAAAEATQYAGGRRWIPVLASVLVRLNPLNWGWALMTPLFARALRRYTAVECTDSVALAAYDAFWGQLKREDLTSSARAGLTYGLWLLRHRNDMPDTHLRYARIVGKYVPAPAIGWNPPPINAVEPSA